MIGRGVAALWCVAGALSCAAAGEAPPQNASVAPDPALVGRWLGTMPGSADYELFAACTFTAESHFVVALEARNRKTGKWAVASAAMKEKLDQGTMFSLFGSYQVAPPTHLLLKTFMGFADMPLEVDYAVKGDELTMKPGPEKEASLPWLDFTCKKVERFEFAEPGAEEPAKREPAGKKRGRLGEMITRGGDGLRAASADELDKLGPEMHHYYFQPATGRWAAHPSDVEMMTEFANHADFFKKEDAMHREDNGTALTEERKAEYAKLEAGLLMTSSYGMFGRGLSKSFAWLASPPAADGAGTVLVTGDMDAYVTQRNRERLEKHKGEAHPPRDAFTVYRHLEGNWYLCYEQD